MTSIISAHSGEFHQTTSFLVEQIKTAIKSSSNNVEESRSNFDNSITERINSNLQKISFDDQSEDVKKKQDEFKTEWRNTLEHSLRYYLAELANYSLQENKSVSEHDIVNLLDLTIWLIVREHLEPSTVFILIEDLFECQTIQACETIFHIIEERKEQLSEPLFIAQRSRIVILRLCINLLKRLSKSNNSAFSGRILIFLASLFSLSDKSGVNPKSEINLNNATEWESNLMDTEDGQFYQHFWQLQQYLQNPLPLLANEGKWGEVMSGIDKILDAFSKNSSQWKSTSQRDSDNSFFAKYLTSSKLMRLELKDAQFCRHVMLQILIMIQGLENVSLVQPKTEIKENQKTALNDLRNKVRRILEKSPPNGKKFSEGIFNILNRENNWIMWKKDQCKPFDKTIPKGSVLATKRKTENNSAPSSKRLQAISGNTELAKMFVGISDEDLSSPDRIYTPALQDFIQPMVEEMDPEADIEDELKMKHNKVYTWKTLRLVAKHKFHYFAKAANKIEEIVTSLENEKKGGRGADSTVNLKDELGTATSSTSEVNDNKEEGENNVVDNINGGEREEMVDQAGENMMDEEKEEENEREEHNADEVIMDEEEEEENEESKEEEVIQDEDNEEHNNNEDDVENQEGEQENSRESEEGKEEEETIEDQRVEEPVVAEENSRYRREKDEDDEEF